MTTTLEDFERYRELRKKAGQLERQIENLEKNNSKRVKDKVIGSMSEFPYAQKSFEVYGLINNSGEIKRKKTELRAKRTEILTLGAKLDGFIKTIDDKEIRETLILYYIDGCTYSEIPPLLGLIGDGSAQRKKARAYLKNHSNTV